MTASYRYTDEGRKHLHTLNDKPLFGTSTVAKVIGKGDALTWWSSGMACAEFGWLNPKKHPADAVKQALEAAYKRVIGLSLSEYEKLVKTAYSAFNTRKNDAAKDGTDMHAELEYYVRACIKNDGKPIDGAWPHKAVKLFSDWSLANVEKFLWSEAHCYSEKLWVGGISDCGAILKDGKLAIIDFKSSKEAYFEQYVQAGGYSLLVEENGIFTADGVQVPIAL
jgi:hypothetical protein